MSNVDEIKARVDIVDLVSETVSLRRSGKNFTGFCPFHANTRTPAFVVFPESGTWRCFSCNEGGDIFNFVMKKEGWDFSQTLISLAKRAGVELEPLTPEKKEEDERLEKLHDLLEEAVTFFMHHLTQSSQGKTALDYLLRRKLAPETIETFGLGYAPESWDATHQYFLGKGHSMDDLKEVGLVVERQEGEGVYDRFRHRVMFPIRDATGRMAGFGARCLRDEDVPKYLNSPQSTLFDKSHLLYGLDLARKAIRKEDQVVIVEGYMDVIGLHQAGFTNAVSPMGTAINEHQFRQLKRFSRRMVLALDADTAGEKATLRGLEMARQSLDRSPDIVTDASGIFDARGLIRSEGRLQADLRVTTLPEGKDPDEIALEDPQAWHAIIQASRPVVEHVMETLAANHNLDDPKVKQEISEQVLPLIEDVPNAVERDGYRQKLARLLRVDERVLVASAARAPRRDRRRRQEPAENYTEAPVLASEQKLATDLELHCLQLLLRHPEALSQVDRALQQAQLSRLLPQDFEKAENQIVAKLVQRSLEQDQLEPGQFIQENMPESLQVIVDDILSPSNYEEPNVNRQIEELVRSVLRLRYIRVREDLDQLRNFQEEVQQQGEIDLESYLEMIVNYSKTRDRIDQALKRPVQLD
jgi:DNA primase